MLIEKWVSKQGEDEFGESRVASAKVLEEQINSRHRDHCISLEGPAIMHEHRARRASATRATLDASRWLLRKMLHII